LADRARRRKPVHDAVVGGGNGLYLALILLDLFLEAAATPALEGSHR
jgi:hypothetical protein